MLIHTEIEEHDGTHYVLGAMSGEIVSPPYTDRSKALDLALKIEALPAEERRLVLAGRVPAPGCEWLIGGGREVRS